VIVIVFLGLVGAGAKRYFEYIQTKSGREKPWLMWTIVAVFALIIIWMFTRY
jgi:hypothetical protein